MMNEPEASGWYKMNKALHLAPREHSHVLYNVLGTVSMPHIRHLP